MDKELCYESGLASLKSIQAGFPHLEMSLDDDDPNVDINMDIPAQLGLEFDINLNLQNIDELHLVVGKLWMCWFPCTEKENAGDFIDTVNSLINGETRILEILKGGKVVKAQLQYQINDEWISKSSGLLTFKLPSFRRKSFNVVQNGKNS